jgi:hypothetical protein
MTSLRLRPVCRRVNCFTRVLKRISAASDTARLTSPPLRVRHRLYPKNLRPNTLPTASFSFGPSCYPLLRPLLTSHSVSLRRPFRHKARSPQVRTHSFTAQPPDLRYKALATRASQFCACSPCSVTPHIRFLFIGSQFRSTLPSHSPSPFCSCASLHSL